MNAVINWEQIISMLACASTILQFFAGSLICKKYITNGSTENDSSIPYIVGLLSASLWLSYGLAVGYRSVVAMNVLGSSLYFCYILIFYRYSPHKKSVRKQIICVILCLMVIHLYISLEEDKNILKNRLGFLASFVGISFCASPLSNAIQVIKLKDAESLPVPIIFMTAVVTFLWFLYGVVLKDTYIQYPNVAGFLFSLLQLVLYAKYRRPTYKLTSINNDI